MTAEPIPPVAPAKRPWAGRLLWTVIPLLLGLALTLVATSRSTPVMYFRFRDGGVLAEIIAGISLLALVFGAIVGRRQLKPAWLVAAPVLVLWAGIAGVALQAAGLREFIAFDLEPNFHQVAFQEGLGEVLHVSGIATLFSALLLVQAAGFLCMRAKPDAAQVRWSKTLAVVGWLACLTLMLVAVHFICNRFADGVPIALATSLAFATVLIGTRNLRRTEPSGAETERAWSMTLVAGVCAIGAVAATIVAGLLHAREVVHSLLGSEAVDPEAKLSRVPAMYERVTENVWNIGFVGLALVVLVLLIGLGARIDGARSTFLRPVGLVLVLLLAPFGAATYQARELSLESLEYGQGSPGELVADRRIEPNTLEVQLVPIAGWGEVTANAEVVLAGKKLPWTPTTPAVFEGLPSDEPIQVGVLGDYLVSPVEDLVMPRRSGARLRIGVLAVLPAPYPDGSMEAEKILHIDATDPARFVLRWAQHHVVNAEEVLPRSLPTLAGAMRNQWRMHGSHANENDRRRDTAIIRFSSSTSLQDLVAIGDAVASQRRSVRVGGSYDMLPAVRPWFARARPSLQELDDELDVDGRSTDVSPGLASWAERALERCAGRPCVNSPVADPWGLEFGERCDTYLCSAETVAKLWRALGMARAVTGDETGAEQAFARAHLLLPDLQLPASAPAAASSAFGRVSRAKVPRVMLGALAVNGRLEPGGIRAALTRREGLVRACYADALGASPSMSGHVMLRMVVGLDGVASDTRIGGHDLPESEVAWCIQRSFRGIQFPKPDAGIVTLIATWRLSPR